MTCEDNQPTRITWEVQLLEPCSRVWMSRGYGRATTTADPLEVARAALTAYLTGHPARPTETFRASVRPDGGPAVNVTADQVPDGWKADDAARRALPLYLRDALPATAAEVG
jgi:hypothetical protein